MKGKSLKKGDVLAVLNPDEYSLLEKQARANFALADVQYKRYKKLRKDQVVSEQDFDEAKANHNSAKAQWDQAKANLRYTQLVAPYDAPFLSSCRKSSIRCRQRRGDEHSNQSGNEGDFSTA